MRHRAVRQTSDMTKSETPSLIDAIEIGEIKIGTLGGQFRALSMEAKYALIISKTGTRLGAGSRLDWSPDTQQKLISLLEAMEQDICEDVFGPAPSIGSGRQEDHPNEDGVPEL